MADITVHGPSVPAVTHHFESDRITIGRSEDNDLVVRDPVLSRRHMELRWEGHAWVAEDLHSLNGTRLNRRPLKIATTIVPGDEIQLGATMLVFALTSRAGAAHSETATVPDEAWSGRGSGRLSTDPEIVGRSAAIALVLDAIGKVAPSSSTVLLLGENGTGKDLVARRIHQGSARAKAPFVIVNCPALPGSLLEAELFGVAKGVATGVDARAGRLESAAGGTVFLDEIGDLDLAAQAKLLRFLQDKSIDRVGERTPRKVDVRLVAATNHDLEAAIERGSFRRDLYHRLNVVAIRLPALRERREDIAVLAEHFLERSVGAPHRLAPDALALLERYPFPGNVRELEHLLERARLFASGPVIGIADLPESVREERPDEAAAGAGSAPGDSATGDELFTRIVAGGESFWALVREPYLRREVSREAALRLVQRGYDEGGRSYKGMARLFRLEPEYKRMMNFLQNHALKVDR